MTYSPKRWTVNKLRDCPGWHWRGLETKILNHLIKGGNDHTVTLVNLPPRKSLPYIRHKKTHEWSFVVQGSLEAVLDGKRVKLKKFDFLYLPPNVWHSFTAGSKGVTALSVYSPPLKWNNVDVNFKGLKGPVSLKIRGLK